MRWITTFAALFLGFGAANAADPEVFMPDGTTRVVFNQSGKFNRVARVAYEKYAPLRVPGGEKESGAPRLKFLQKVMVIGDFEQGVKAGTGLFLPIASYPDNGPLGWVPRDVVVFGAECMTDPASGIHIKAMVVNSLAYLSDKTIPANEKRPPPLIRLGPDDKTRDIGPFRFFDFYFVWADTDKAHPDRGYALLGDRNAFNANLEASESDETFPAFSKILGWVDKSRLCFWRTREAIQWNDGNPNRTEPVRAYATPELALADLNAAQPATAPGQPETVIEEFDKGKPVRWESWRMRYPVLFTKDDADKENGGWSSKKIKRADGGLNTVFNIGVIGDVFDKDGNRVFKQADKAVLNRKLDEAKEQINNLQIVFVIDRTDSMQDCWDATADSVKRLIDQVKRKGRTVSIAFCYYADVWKDGQEGKITDYEQAIKGGGVFPGQFFDAGDDKLVAAKLAELRDPKQVKEAGNRLEMVYAGLEAGLFKCGSWKAKARKMVVLLGDDGNHVFEPEVESAIQERLATFCARGGTKLPPQPGEEVRTPIEFYALQVLDVPRGADDKHPRRLFQSQMQSLRDRINKKAGGNRAEYFNTSASKANAFDKAEFLKAIEARYAVLQAAADEIAADIDKVKSGQVTTRFEIKNPDSLAIIMELAALENPNKPDSVFEGSQVFESRYVWLKGPRTGDQLNDRQIRSMILVSDGELHFLLSVLEDVFDAERPNPPELEDVAAALIRVHSGSIKDPEELENFKKLPVRKQLDKVMVGTGFTFPGKLSQFLGYDAKDDAKKDVSPPRKPTPQEKAQLLQEMQKRFYKLKGIRTDKVYIEKGSNKWDPVVPADYEPRGFTKGGGQAKTKTPMPKDDKIKQDAAKSGIWYWIDVDEEWL